MHLQQDCTLQERTAPRHPMSFPCWILDTPSRRPSGPFVSYSTRPIPTVRCSWRPLCGKPTLINMAPSGRCSLTSPSPWELRHYWVVSPGGSAFLQYPILSSINQDGASKHKKQSRRWHYGRIAARHTPNSVVPFVLESSCDTPDASVPQRSASSTVFSLPKLSLELLSWMKSPSYANVITVVSHPSD